MIPGTTYRSQCSRYTVTVTGPLTWTCRDEHTGRRYDVAGTAEQWARVVGDARRVSHG